MTELKLDFDFGESFGTTSWGIFFDDCLETSAVAGLFAAFRKTGLLAEIFPLAFLGGFAIFL